MRIRDKVALVGGIPVFIAAAIAVTAWMLLSEAERARQGAVLAGAAYRDLASVTTARNNYVLSAPAGRERHAAAFDTAAQSASRQLNALGTRARDGRHRAATNEVGEALRRHRAQMAELQAVSRRNDQLISEMDARAALVIGLADKARERQHESNTDIIASLRDGDRRLRALRDIVDHAVELRAAAASLEIQRRNEAVLAENVSDQALSFSRARLRNAVLDTIQVLRANNHPGAASQLAALARANGVEIASEQGPPAVAGSWRALADWVERLTKVNSSEHRALHDQLAQLLTYSVEAAETEQATQNIAIATLKLGQRAAEALSARDAAATGSILAEAQTLSRTMAALPISPLIQSEMIDAIERWREGLATTADGLRLQNEILRGMDTTAESMILAAGAINETFTGEADRMGRFVQSILALGAALGLLLGSGTAFFVARSITRPLKRLEEHMRALAANPVGGKLPDAARRDELGAMAHAANFFVTEIGRRENDLRKAKETTEAAMAELKQAQTNLIQAEKLASLGQLVAGVAHEINTPIGVALTTSTALSRDVRSLDEKVKSGRVARADLHGILARLSEGGQLIFANLTRAIDLIHSFKQVAADRASGEQRSFELRSWLQEVVTSLGPVLRKGGHHVEVDCPDGLILTSYPGALAQVLTNLTMNAVIHAFPDGRTGTLRLTVRRSGSESLTLVFADDGAGIAEAYRSKVFDPFFTTGRDRGSTGLGLHIVHNLVTVTLRGRIELESTPGHGTTFTIEIPAALDEARPQPFALTA
jgi:signal transduction histidine kinase